MLFTQTAFFTYRKMIFKLNCCFDEYYSMIYYVIIGLINNTQEIPFPSKNS